MARETFDVCVIGTGAGGDARRLLELADAAGAVEKWAPQLEGISPTDERSAAKGSAHFHGTCRMGHDPTRSGVDEW
jgi:choline dehydrogenase-like flavoprotein